MMDIKAIGVVTKNHGDGRFVDVDWEPRLDPVKEWYFYTNRSTVWRVLPGEWMTDALIDFTFSAGKPRLQGARYEKTGFREPVFLFNGGEGGIRTLGAVNPHNSLAGSPIQPLSHLSKVSKRPTNHNFARLSFTSLRVATPHIEKIQASAAPVAHLPLTQSRYIPYHTMARGASTSQAGQL